MLKFRGGGGESEEIEPEATDEGFWGRGRSLVNIVCSDSREDPRVDWVSVLSGGYDIGWGRIFQGLERPELSSGLDIGTFG